MNWKTPENIASFMFMKKIGREKGQAKAHDYSKGSWGHSCSFMDDKYTRVAGFGRGVEEGDYLIFEGQKGGKCVFKITKLEYMRDPADQFFASVTQIKDEKEGGKALSLLETQKQDEDKYRQDLMKA